MPRDTNLDEILFPVELRDLFVELEDATTQPQLFDYSLEDQLVMRLVPKHKAVVNTQTGRPLAVVGWKYHLVTNEEALWLGEQCFRQLFRGVDSTQMEVFNIIAPKSKVFCHIDIIRKGYEVNVWSKELWLPYLRVTNSYNGSRALRFDLGFCRELCRNGISLSERPFDTDSCTLRRELSLWSSSARTPRHLRTW